MATQQHELKMTGVGCFNVPGIGNCGASQSNYFSAFPARPYPAPYTVTGLGFGFTFKVNADFNPAIVNWILRINWASPFAGTFSANVCTAIFRELDTVNGFPQGWTIPTTPGPWAFPYWYFAGGPGQHWSYFYAGNPISDAVVNKTGIVALFATTVPEQDLVKQTAITLQSGVDFSRAVQPGDILHVYITPDFNLPGTAGYTKATFLGASIANV